MFSDFFRVVLPSLEKCIHNVWNLKIFFRGEKDKIIQLYGKYCMNYPKVGYIMNEFEEYFNVSSLSIQLGPMKTAPLLNKYY